LDFYYEGYLTIINMFGSVNRTYFCINSIAIVLNAMLEIIMTIRIVGLNAIGKSYEYIRI
jgi:hypothetical protein